MYDINRTRALASNIVGGKNPEFTVEDFLELMPSFGGQLFSEAIVQHYIDMAHAVVKKSRWHELWTEGMRLYVAHFLTLYAMTYPTPEAGKNGILKAGGVNGVASSKTVDGVSVSYDINVANGDLTGWGAWKLTSYGTQFATLARMLGKGGMYVR